jgi:hypothetical protein
MGRMAMNDREGMTNVNARAMNNNAETTMQERQMTMQG